MSKELFELPKDEFLKEISTNWDKWKDVKGVTIKALAKYGYDNALTVQALGSLEKMGKPKLLNLLIKGDEIGSKDNKDLKENTADSNEVVELVNDIKMMVQEKQLHSTIKDRLTRHITAYIATLEDKSYIEKFNAISLVLTLILTALDVFIDGGIKNARPKIMSLISKLKKSKEVKAVNDK